MESPKNACASSQKGPRCRQPNLSANSMRQPAGASSATGHREITCAREKGALKDRLRDGFRLLPRWLATMTCSYIIFSQIESWKLYVKYTLVSPLVASRRIHEGTHKRGRRRLLKRNNLRSTGKKSKLDIQLSDSRNKRRHEQTARTGFWGQQSAL